MKQIIHVILILLLLVLALSGSDQQKKEQSVAVPEIYRAFAAGNFNAVVTLTDKAMAEYGKRLELVQMKYEALLRLQRLDDALALIDSVIKEKGESETLLSARFNVLLQQEKLTEALQTALKKDKLAKIKSPWDCMNIMHVYLKMKSKDEAMDWLQEAVKRGFISYRILMEKTYDLLRYESRFYEIIETIKVSIGLGYPAKPIETPLLSGETFKLNDQRGKVILVTFWATWCEPCKKDMTELKNIYNTYRDKGFDMLSISLDGSLTRLNAYLNKEQINWKQACSTLEWKDATVIRYGINSVPSYWLMDKKGVLRAFDLKGMELRLAIRDLLAER